MPWSLRGPSRSTGHHKEQRRGWRREMQTVSVELLGWPMFWGGKLGARSTLVLELTSHQSTPGHSSGFQLLRNKTGHQTGALQKTSSHKAPTGQQMPSCTTRPPPNLDPKGSIPYVALRVTPHMETFRTEPILPAFPLLFCRIPGARGGSCRCVQPYHSSSSLAEISWAQTLTNRGHLCF